MTMSYKKMGSGAGSGNYYINSAGLKATVRGVDDYYQQAVGSEPNGTFTDFSGALERYGIKHGDEVTVTSFERLLNGRDPVNDLPLTETVDEKHVSGFDFTNGAPKPFSALRALAKSFGNDELDKILHKIGIEANQDSMQFFSDQAGFTRPGKGGKKLEKIDLFSVQWEHGTSREADPHKHYHNTIFNLAFRKDGKCRAVESKYLMQWQTAAGAVFRAGLAMGLKKEFPDINIIINEKKGTFEIDGINEDLINFWSKRRNEIQKNMAATGATSLAAADLATLQTRKDKEFDESPEQLDARWKVEAESFGVTAQSIQDVLTTKSGLIYDMSPAEKDALDKQTFEAKMNAIPSMLIENESVFTEQALYRKVAELSAGIQDLAGIKETVNRLLKVKEADLVAKEKEVLTNVKEMKNGIRNRESRSIGTDGRFGRDESAKLGAGGLGNRSGASQGFTYGASDSQSNPAAVVARRVRAGQPNSMREMYQSALARDRSTKTSKGLLRTDASNSRRTIDNLRRNVLNKPVTAREQALNEQRDPNSVIIEMGYTKKGQKIFTTLAQIKVEADLKKRSIEMSNDGTHAINKKIIADAISKKTTISLEQADAVRWALSPGSLKIIEGGAGTGKSYSMDVTREICEASGYNMIGIALSWDAADVLKNSANINSVAIAGFLDRLERGTLKLTKMDVIVCDENGLVGSVYGQKILKFVQEAGAKIIITGDSQQLNPVSAGSAMKIMLSEAGSAKITEIRRQKQEWAREMVANFAAGKSTEALTALKDHNKINMLVNRQSTIDLVSSDFYNYLKNNTGKTALAICGSNEEAALLNKSIREMKRIDGFISKTEIIIPTEFGDLPFSVGDKIMFRKNDNKLDVKNRKTAEILGIDSYKDGFQLRVKMLEDGREVTVDSRKYQGETGKLALHHGDAVTTYSSQGQTVDETFVMHSSGMDRRLAYVAFSRHKDETHLYVDQSSVVAEMQSKLSEKLKPTEKDILDHIANQYHNQSQKETVFEYLTDDEIEKILEEHAVKPAAKVEYDNSEIEKMAEKWTNLMAGWDDPVSISDKEVVKNSAIFKKPDPEKYTREKEDAEIIIEDADIAIRNRAKLG